MKYFVLAVILNVVSSIAFAQTQGQPQEQTKEQAQLCAMAAETTTAPRVADGVTLPHRTMIPSRGGFTLAGGAVVDFMDSDIYTYDAGNPTGTVPKFYARYRDLENNVDNEPNAPRVGMMELNREFLPAEMFQGGITCPVKDSYYQPHWFQPITADELICVKRLKDYKTTYAVIQVDAVCQTPHWGIVFNWVATNPVDSEHPNVFKADQVQIQKP